MAQAMRTSRFSICCTLQICIDQEDLNESKVNQANRIRSRYQRILTSSSASVTGSESRGRVTGPKVVRRCAMTGKGKTSPTQQNFYRISFQYLQQKVYRGLIVETSKSRLECLLLLHIFTNWTSITYTCFSSHRHLRLHLRHSPA